MIRPKIRNHWIFFFLLLVLSLNSGCGLVTEEVPGGTLGIRTTPNGYDHSILQPGNHFCIQRDRLYLIPTTLASVTEKIKVRMKDSQAVYLPVTTTFRIRMAQGKRGLKAKDLISIIKNFSRRYSARQIVRRISLKTIYQSRIRPTLRESVQNYVSPYTARELMQVRSKVMGLLRKNVFASFTKEGFKLVTLTVGVIDLPDGLKKELVTQARRDERKRTRILESKGQFRVDLEEHRRKIAKQNRDKILYKGRIELAKLKGMAAVVEDQVAIRSIKNFDRYVKYRSIELASKALEVRHTLYKKMGAGDKMLITQGGSPAIPYVNFSPSTGKTPPPPVPTRKKKTIASVEHKRQKQQAVFQ